MKIAIYDLDRTVTKSGTYTRFLLDAAMSRARWRILLLPVVMGCALAYKAGLITRRRLKEVGFRLLIGPSLPRAEMDEIASIFALKIIARGLYPGAIDRMNADRGEGYEVVLATASPEYYARIIADHLDIRVVIATRHRIGANGETLSAIDGENCYGMAKRDRVKAWFQSLEKAGGTPRIRFYSDDVSDEPMFDWADEPFIVNPGAGERALARRTGWPILSFAGQDVAPST